MFVGFASIIGGYATTVISGRFSDNKQWNPIQKGIVCVMISLWMENTMSSRDKSRDDPNVIYRGTFSVVTGFNFVKLICAPW
jgi:hypothetical protein